MRGRVVHVHLAHMPGACGLAPSTDGVFALTTGSDATIRPHDIRDSPEAWWRADNPVEQDLPELAADMHEKPVSALALAPNNRTAATACDDGHVRLFSVSEDGKEATLIQPCARFGGPVRAVAFSPTGSFVTAAGDEPGVIKIIMTAQPSHVNILRAPPGGPGNQPVIDLAYDPRSDFIAAAGEKGEAAVWNVDACKFVCAVELNNRKANCVTWTPDGDSLVYGTDKGIVIVARDTWMFDCLLEDVGDRDDEDDGIFTSTTGRDDVTAVACSPNGRYLLASREDCTTSLWDIHEKKVLGSWKSETSVQKILWHPKSNSFMLIDKIGQWGMMSDVVPPHMPSPHAEARAVELPALPEINEKEKKKPKETAEDDDDGEGVIRRSKGPSRRNKKESKKSKKPTGKKTKGPEVKSGKMSGEDDDNQELENGFTFNASDVEADEEDKLRHEENDKNSDASGDYDEESESDEELDGELAGLENGGVRLPESRRRRGNSSKKESVRRARNAGIVHQPFMPSSTPLSEKLQKKKHILCWNLVGVILSYAEDTHDIIEIEFAEASKRTVGIKDHFGYTMGCLTETGVFLASPRKKDHGSLITFRPFSSWASSSDWTQFLQPQEDIGCIAMGQRFAAVATKPNNVVRLFSLSGIQTTAFGLPGTVISMTAAEDNLAVVYVETDSTSLKCELLDISPSGDVEKVKYSGSLMLCANSSLEWIGFTSDTNELCSYDSQGWLWLMPDPKNSKRWLPLMQEAAKVGECDWFWVAAVTSDHLVGVPCLSNERFPPAKPRPSLRSLPLCAPVIEKATKTGKPTVIERLARTKLNLHRAVLAKAEAEEMYDSEDEEIGDAEERVSRLELETDKCLLALMEDACRREQNLRALDLVTRLQCRVSFKYATELANHYRRTALASRVEQVALKKMQMMQEEAQHRTLKAAKTGISPLTPQAAHNRAGQSGAVVTTSKAAVVAMNFGSDDDEATGQPNVRSNMTKRVRSDEKKISMADVTDDEEDSQRTEPESKPATPERKVKSESRVDKKPQVKKRNAPLAASQASVGGAVAGKMSNSKKPRVTGVFKQDTANAGKRSVRNRFAKK